MGFDMSREFEIQEEKRKSEIIKQRKAALDAEKIAKKAEENRRRESIAAINSAHPIQDPAQPRDPVLAIDCPTCKAAASMVATRLSKHNWALRVIGYCLAPPALIGAFFGITTSYSSCSTANEMITKPDSGLAAAVVGGFGMTFGVTLTMVALLFLGVAYALLAKRNVLRCHRCGYLVDRA